MTEAIIGRDVLIEAITTFLYGHDAGTLGRIRVTLERAIDAAGPEALALLGDRLAHAGEDWDYYPADPLARHIHHLLADKILESDSALGGAAHLDAVAGAPVVMFANHLSYSDANLLEILFNRLGAAALSDRLTAIAGPKVYSSLKRRFSSLCFGTIKVPQSSAVSSEDAIMNPRDIAIAARRSIDAAHERLRLGDALLVFAEGTRSRTKEMQPMLTGVTRYLDGPEALVLPVAIMGTEEMFPIGDDTIHPVRIEVRAGRPIPARALTEEGGGDRRLMMDCVGLAIARLLPPEYQGAYAGDAPELAGARDLLARLDA